MKRRSDRLERVRTLAATEERDYCRAMGDAQRSLDAHEARLEELLSYRREYAARRGHGAGRTVSSAQYADYCNFLQRLDDAVHAQNEVVRSNRQNRDAHRERWIQKRRKSESLQRVVERARDDETRADARKQPHDLPRPADPFGRGEA